MAHSFRGEMNKMSNNLKNQKTIERESTRKLLHRVGSCPPATDPFSRLNVQRPVGVKKCVYNIIALMKSRQKIVEFKYMYRY